MTIEYRYEEAWNCVLIRVSGAMQPDEYRLMIRQQSADSRIRPGHLRFNDTRRVNEIPDADTTRAFAQLSNEFERMQPMQRSAILVAGETLFGMARLFQAHRGESDEKIGVFQGLAQAFEWLGLPADAPDPFSDEAWEPEWSSAGL